VDQVPHAPHPHASEEMVPLPSSTRPSQPPPPSLPPVSTSTTSVPATPTQPPSRSILHPTSCGTTNGQTPVDLLDEELVYFLGSLGSRSSPLEGRRQAYEDIAVATRRLSFKEALLSPKPMKHRTQGVHAEGCPDVRPSLSSTTEVQWSKLRSVLVIPKEGKKTVAARSQARRLAASFVKT
jgi:hypothetical protein